MLIQKEVNIKAGQIWVLRGTPTRKEDSDFAVVILSVDETLQQIKYQYVMHDSRTYTDEVLYFVGNFSLISEPKPVSGGVPNKTTDEILAAIKLMRAAIKLMRDATKAPKFYGDDDTYIDGYYMGLWKLEQYITNERTLDEIVPEKETK